MGMPDSVILSRLILEGWSQEALRPALGDTNDEIMPVRVQPTFAPAPLQKAIPQRKPLPYAAGRRGISTATLLALLIACGAVGGALYMFLKPPVVYSISISPDNAASASVPLIYGALPALSEPTYYQSVKDNLAAQKASFIDANLSAMRLVVYLDGESKLEVPILAKGRPGSWWETPAGLYKIETKEKMHFSTISDVAMPYSLDFQGNFFIHGWPIYPDGTPVSSTHSGGCIRLSTADAQRVYTLAAVGMPVVVYNEQSVSDPFDYQVKAPAIGAEQYLVADVKNGTVLTSQGAGVEAPIASITKLMTALVATEYINLDKKISVPREALVHTAVPRLKAGQNVRAYDLLFLLLQESSNEAAETLAASRGRDQFVEYMNQKAKAINLQHTHFNDPSGAENDFSTPEDLFTLLRYVYDNRRFVFDITTGELTDSAYGKPTFRGVNNFNVIKNAPAALLGGKVGQTNEAGETYAGIFAIDIGEQTRQIAVIVLGSKDVQTDVKKLLQFVKTSYAPAE